ncbi:MAG: PQQ-dependent sugar dehydrogenase [Chloroflexota bacterium]|nr:PQQ-dependent sugar dehydrogenase [Chloroflexota bacterium]
MPLVRPKRYRLVSWIGFLFLASLSLLGVRSGAGPLLFDPGPPPETVIFELVPFITEGLSKPTAVTHAGDERLFVLERGGLIRVVLADGEVLPEPFLDLQQYVAGDNIEQGLLGLAFHPEYAKNGYFYVDYTNVDGNTVISRFQVRSDNPNIADETSEFVILTIEQPSEMHNGGQLAFGPDGYLYIGVGDGGGGGNSSQNGQALGTLLGKILRIDVDGATPYAIPSDNPFVGVPGALEEIWAYGLRNPWRFSFDRNTGDIYIGDVGEGQSEEIDFQPADSGGGKNYGWAVMEGRHCFEPPEGCDRSGLIEPIWEYGREQGVAVIGGYVYRGKRYPSLRGDYFFGDWGTGKVWRLRKEADGWRVLYSVLSNDTLFSFGEDVGGEVYVAGMSGTLYRLIAPSPANQLSHVE